MERRFRLQGQSSLKYIRSLLAFQLSYAGFDVDAANFIAEDGVHPRL